MIVRNSFGIVGAAALYVGIIYALHFLEPKGRDAILMLFALHVGFGIVGHFIFSGSALIRALCVFLVILGYGIVIEYVEPDPRHELVQVFAAIGFGILASVSTLVGCLLDKIRIRARAASQV